MKILHLIDTLNGDDGSRQLELLALEPPRDGCSLAVCCIGPASRQTAALAKQGVCVHVLGWTRWLDWPALSRLRTLVRGDYDLVHVWRMATLRMLSLVAADRLPRTIVSAPLGPDGKLMWWDRRLLRRVRCLVLAGDDERQRCMRQGLGDVPWRGIPAAAPQRAGGIPAWAQRYPRRVACAGPLLRSSGFREAIWAVDVLRHVFPDVHLLIAGEGPFRADLEAMIGRLHIDNAHLLGDDYDPAEVLAAAEICWVPSGTGAGPQAALEAMALGLPVIAADSSGTRALIRDGETGCLVPAADPVALARQTRALLANPPRAARLGAMARAAAARFALPQVAARWHALYNDMAA